MYLLMLTLKTASGIFAVAVLLYTIVLAFVCPVLKRKDKKAVMVFLCLLPLLAGIVHFLIYGTSAFFNFFYLYVLVLLPLINLLPGKKKVPVALKSILSALGAMVVSVVFLFDLLGTPVVHNFTRMSYTQSFKTMLQTLEKEYCLNSWKKIDYGYLLNEYLPKVEEAEKNKDEAAYAAVIAEVTYRFYDSHVYAQIGDEPYEGAMKRLAGNDYGLSMVKLDDGTVVAVFVEPEEGAVYEKPCNLTKLGIHDGTRIVSWDGKDINEAMSEVECINLFMQFPVKSNEDFFRPAFLAGNGGDSVEVAFINDDGNEQHVRLQKLGDYSDRLSYVFARFLQIHDYTPNYTSKMISGKCGYIKIRAEHYDTLKDNIAVLKEGYYPELTEFFAKKIEDLKSQGMEYLVIDIRNNAGGYDNVAGALASLFTTGKKHLCAFGYEDAQGYHITENEYIFPDGRYKDLPVAVLVNAQCVSAGDGMAKFLGECDNVTLMGITASAGVNQNNGGLIYLTKNISVSYPIALTLSSEGVPLIDTDSTRENRIPLEVKIPMTKELALKIFTYGENTEDPQLDYVIGYLEGTIKAEKPANPDEDDGPAPPFDGSRISSVTLEAVNSNGTEFALSPDYCAGNDLVILCNGKAELSLGRVFKYSPNGIEDIAGTVKKMDEGSDDVKGYIADITKHCTFTKTDGGYALTIDSECVNTETNYYVELSNGVRLIIRCK